MKVNEVEREIPKSTPTRFQKAAKTAKLDGQPIDPKKLMPMIHRSLNDATGWKWQFAYKKITPKLIHVQFYYDEHESDIEVGIDLQIAGPKMFAWISSICNMITMGDRHILLRYNKEMTTKLINTMWSKKIVKQLHDTCDEDQYL